VQPGTLNALEFDKILDLLAGQALTPLGRARALELDPMVEPDEIGGALALTSEAVAFRAAGGSLSLSATEDLGDILASLEVDGQMLVGVCHLPALGDTIAAARGCGCAWNGRPARVTKTSALTEATIVYSDSRLLARRLGTGWDALQQASLLQRGWGDCYGHCLVATGRADVMLDPVMNPWDCAALVPILQESGGRFTDWRGRSRIDGGDAVSTNGHLHDDVLGALAGAVT